MNVLFLGGNGYLGSKIVRLLASEGNKIVCTKRAESDLSRLEDIKDKIIWIPASVDAIDVATQYTSFDYVLNVACNYGRSNVLYDNVIEANIEFPLNVLNKAVESGVRNFLTIGTGLPEEFNMYSFSKKIFGDFGRFYGSKHNINFYNLKLEMFYGSDEPKNRFLPSVICKMIKGEEVDTTLGTQRRDIIAVSDIVSAVMLVLNSHLSGYHDIAVGTGVAPSVSEIIDFIWEETGKKSKVNKGAILMRENEPDCIADTTLLKSLGKWNPIDWKVGIQQLILDMKIEISGGN